MPACRSRRMIMLWMRRSVGVAPLPLGMDAGLARWEMGMNDARCDRPRTGQAAGDATPAEEPDRQSGSEEADVALTRDWTRRKLRRRSEAPLLVHWIDEKGAVVRLISSSQEQDTGGGAA